MDKISVYEQVGIVIPGSVLLVGLLFYYPTPEGLLTQNGVTVGQFGIFLLLSYALGHLIAAIGNALEAALWKAFGGMPTNWVTRQSGSSLLSSYQVEMLTFKVRSRLNVSVENIVGLDHKAWWPLTRQIYADVAKSGKPQRIDTFNGNYGLNRGLAASTLVLAIVGIAQTQINVGLSLLVLSLVYAYRAYRFGVHYARELFVQFLILDDPPSSAAD